MNKSSDTLIIYDFFGKSIRDIGYARRNQASDHNFKSIPATIIGVSDYETLQCVDVKFLISDVYTERDNLVLESMTLKKVLVRLPEASGFSIQYPVAVGDKCNLIWSHRDLGDFLDGDGSEVEVNINEIAQIEDCVVELGYQTRKNNLNPSATNFVIKGENTSITFMPDGTFNITTSGEGTFKGQKIILDAPETEVTGNISILGDSEVTGNSTVTGSAQFMTTADVIGILTAAGIPVNTHKHTDAENRPTGIMEP